jgi:hypothetical protein
MSDPKYKAFTALDPFFDIVRQGLVGQVDGEHYFDTIAENSVFEFRYIFPGWPQKVNGREALMALYAGGGLEQAGSARMDAAGCRALRGHLRITLRRRCLWLAWCRPWARKP